jgi:hypothetical protein
MKTIHLDHASLTGYIYGTLDDAQREDIDAHLTICPVCRGKLDEQQQYMRQISNELSVTINQAWPSNQMSFAAIANQLQANRLSWNLWQRIEFTAPVALALSGLLLSLLGLWQYINLHDLTASSRQFSTLPTLACFFLLLASVEEFEKAFTIRPRFALIVLVSVILWLGTALIGLLNIIVIRDLTIMAVVAAGGKAAEAGPVVILAVMGAALLYIGFVIGGAEYHYRNVGQPNSWKLFSITLLGQLFILILPYLLI